MIDYDSLIWTKSSFSNGSANNCVEIAKAGDGQIALRDTKDRSKAPHLFNAEEWSAFISGAKNGEFDA